MGNAKKFAAYLKAEVKKGGNLSEAQFLNIIQGWGTPMHGVAKEIASALIR